MKKCPKCGSPRVMRSRSRTLVERVRKSISKLRLHRCQDCEWRGWGQETADDPSTPEFALPQETPDLVALDVAMREKPREAAPPKRQPKRKYR